MGWYTFDDRDHKRAVTFFWLSVITVFFLALIRDSSADTDGVIRIPTVAEQTEACIGTPDETACLAQLAGLRLDPAPCQRAQDSAACRQLAGQALEANCTEADPILQRPCLIIAATVGADVSIIERHYPPGSSERAQALAILAGELNDLSILDQIEDNEQYDLARTAAILTMSESQHRELSPTYCNNLRDHYQSEYPGDAKINWNVCRSAIALIKSIYQALDGLESDEARLDYLRNQLDHFSQTQQAIEEGLDIEPVADDPFGISFIRAPTEVLINGPPSDLIVAWSGQPALPLTVIYRPRAGLCPEGFTCPTVTHMISEDTVGPVALPSNTPCTEQRSADVFFDYELVLVDAVGQETPAQAAGYTCVRNPDDETPVTGPAWKLARMVPNPSNGPLSDDTPRLSTACTPGTTTLSIAHSRRISNATSVDVTFTFSFEPLPERVDIGAVVDVPITLSVAGQHISENVGATAGFLGYRDSLGVASCSLAACGGNPDAMPEQSGVARILFAGAPSDPTQTFEVDAFLNDTTQVGSNCRTRYIYEFVPATP